MEELDRGASGIHIKGMYTGEERMMVFCLSLIHILPGQDVRLDDGLFEVTLIKRPKNPLELNEIIASLLMQEDHTDLIDSFKTDRIIIESNQEISWTLDLSLIHISYELWKQDLYPKIRDGDLWRSLRKRNK